MTSMPPHPSLRRRPQPVFARCVLAVLALSGAGRAAAQQPSAPPADTTAATSLTADQLQSLVAPIALYPDDLLAQTLVAATYPLEVIQLQQWLARHPDLKEKALADSVATQPWDPSIQSAVRPGLDLDGGAGEHRRVGGQAGGRTGLAGLTAARAACRWRLM